MAAPETPLMQQYREIKARHRDAILLFRMGDFYEMFYEDAEIGARALGLVLTSRNNGGAAAVPLAGVPAKAVNEYVRRLMAHGPWTPEDKPRARLLPGRACWQPGPRRSDPRAGLTPVTADLEFHSRIILHGG